MAQHIDQQIHANYRLFANNYIALDLLENNNQYSNYYTHEEKQSFEGYIAGQLNKIQIENKRWSLSSWAYINNVCQPSN